MLNPLHGHQSAYSNKVIRLRGTNLRAVYTMFKNKICIRGSGTWSLISYSNSSLLIFMFYAHIWLKWGARSLAFKSLPLNGLYLYTVYKLY